ncbi:MAG TPA: hypothetical protein VM370_11205 [Candidatus Thermoplasmatota archaeon]|nr:hypothetical protein [Candidatus Thermoplasmatota archaeon]
MLARLLPIALALLGLAKAGAVIVVGLAIGLSPLLVSIAASLWITGPSTVAWVIAERRRKRAHVGLVHERDTYPGPQR